MSNTRDYTELALATGVIGALSAVPAAWHASFAVGVLAVAAGGLYGATVGFVFGVATLGAVGWTGLRLHAAEQALRKRRRRKLNPVPAWFAVPSALAPLAVFLGGLTALAVSAHAIASLVSGA